ncbi:hypothetical protein PGT21_005481 [Puccinia graminis f. sp. tritici]|uniref:Uncharacterized protein n=1 Tax=Puccinia graminis f. sp. tritici TaxID=56615 RepID=A0A5B0MQF5_PUCGR|nr:hypothetical protein PGT21_005481 [Puccinia graminis f. sp. tritici]KAA1133616.1 hypothetical protein PGTUg99_027903 [Puccinia graminis f. sp. tritici]
MFRREVFMPAAVGAPLCTTCSLMERWAEQTIAWSPEKSRGFRRSDSPPEFLPPQGVGIIFRRAL